MSAYYFAIRDRLQRTVDAIRGMDGPTLDEIETVLTENEVTRIEFSILDSKPGLWGYSGDWHCYVRQLRNSRGYNPGY